MRKIDVNKIKKVVSELCIKANINLKKDVLTALKRAERLEKNRKAKKVLGVLIENASIAKKERIAICQDTGIVCVYLEVGQDVSFAGGGLEKAVHAGVKDGYRKGYFRNSLVDPLTRQNTQDNTPAIMHTRIIKGNKVRISVVPKGFGCENRNQIRMFRPTAGIAEIIKFIVNVVKETGSNACPPYVVGIGIGGTFEKAAELSKEALLVKLTAHSSKFRALERKLLKDINKLKIGPSGVGGKTTALAVNILAYPTHIAGLPVAVSIGCHAMRSATRVI